MRRWMLSAALITAGLAHADDEYGEAVHVQPPARPFLLLDARRRYLPRERAHVYVQRRGGGAVTVALYRVRDARDFVARALTLQGVSVAQQRWGAEAEALLRASGPLPRDGASLSLVATRAVTTEAAAPVRRAVGDETAAYESNENDEGMVDTWGVRTRDWGVADVDLGALPAGTYFARAHDGMFATSALLSVGDTVLLARRGDARDVVRVSDGEGSPLASVEVEAVSGDEVVRSRTNEQGEAEFPASPQPERRFQLARGDELAWADVTHARLPPCDTRVYLGTGRPVYRPGEAVRVRGHVRGCGPLAGARVRVYPTAAGPQGETVTADADGNFSATLSATERVGAEVEGRAHVRTLSLDARVVPRGTLRLSLDRAWAASGESVTATVTPPPGTRSVRFDTPAGERVVSTSGGAATTTFTVPATDEALARVTVSATASMLGEVVTARASLWTGRVREVLALDGDTTMGATDETRALTLHARDLGGAPAPGPVTVTVSGSDGNRALGETRWRAEVSVPSSGTAAVPLRLAGSGPWWVRAARGEAVATRVVWERPRPAVLSGSGAFAVIPEANTVGVGEALRVAVRTAGPAWVTLENGGVWASQWAAPGRDGIARVRFDPPAESRGIATVVATRVDGGRVETVSAVAEVASSERFALAMETDRRTYDAGAQARVIVRSRTTAGRPKDAVLSLWVEDEGWWGLGEERHPSVDDYFRATGRPASAGDSARPVGYGSEEGRRLESAMRWNNELVPGTTFRHAWGHGGALVSFEARGDVATLAGALARAAGMNGATMCPARLREFGAVALSVRELPWDLAAERLAARTRTYVTRVAGGLRFACDRPPMGAAGSAHGRGGFGSGSGMGYGGGRAALRERLEGTQWFLAARRIGPTGELAIDVPLPQGPGRWRIHALAIADDGAGATTDADVDTTLPFTASLHLPRALAVGDEASGEVVLRSATRSRDAVGLSVVAEGSVALAEPVATTVTPDAEGVARVGFRLRGSAVGAGRVTVRATRDGSTLDAVEAPVTVRADAAMQPLDVRAAVTAEPTDIDVPIPPLAATATLRVRVDASLEAAIREALEGLRAPRWDLGPLHVDRLASLRALETAAASLRDASAAALRAELAREIEGSRAALRAMRGSDGSIGWWSQMEGSAWLSATALALGADDARVWSDAWSELRAGDFRGALAARVAAAFARGPNPDRARVSALLDRMDATDLASLTWALRAARGVRDVPRAQRFARALGAALDGAVADDRRAPCAGPAWFLCFAREGTRGHVAAAARELLTGDPSARASVLRAARWVATRPEETARWSWGSAEADVLALMAALDRATPGPAPVVARMGDAVLAQGDARAGVTVTVREAGTLRLSFESAAGRFARVSVTGELAVAPPSGTVGPASLVRTFTGEGDARAMTLAFELPRDATEVEVHAPIPAAMELAIGADSPVAQRDPIRGWVELDGPAGDTRARVTRLDDGVRVRFTRLRAGAHAVRIPLAVVGSGRFNAGSAWLRCADVELWSVTPSLAVTLR